MATLIVDVLSAQVDGTTHGPAYYNGNAHLRLGAIEHLTRIGDICGFAEMLARARAIKDINLRCYLDLFVFSLLVFRFLNVFVFPY